ncbi:MAG TPA: hypothetical protein VHG89_05000 [Verrucomicrobiae bacterium]|nr:hypothetical protein [Verrucomicrobiae bacterium]
MSVAIENLIPHRAPMRFIETLIECSEKIAVATARFDEKNFAVTDGMTLETALIECAAQTAAAALGRGKENGDRSGAEMGMLVAVSNFKIESRPPAGKNLRIEIAGRKRLGPMQIISSKIFCDGCQIASGDLTLYA